METNVIVQTALLAVLPLVMQGLKKIPFVENNKSWLCPLLCIIAATATAYFMALPSWLLVGIITGAACNKIYDWGKDLSGAVAPVLLLCLVLTAGMLGGCGADGGMRDYVIVSNGVEGAAHAGVPLVQAGVLSSDRAAVYAKSLDDVNDILKIWRGVIDANDVSAELSSQAHEILDRLIDEQVAAIKRSNGKN